MASAPPSEPAAALADPRAAQRHRRRLAAADSAPWLHGEVARRMGARLQVIRLRPQTVLDWGSFLGASDAPLSQAYPQAERLRIEPDPVLAARSMRELQRPWWSPQRWAAPSQRALLEAEVSAGAGQVLWANMALHAVPDPAAEIARWHRALAVDGFLMFSCLGPDTLKELRALYAREGWPPPTQAFVDMHDLGDMLVEAGFADPVMDQETIRLTWPHPEAALAELRATGGNLSPRRAAGCRTPRWRARLMSALASLAGADGRLGLSVEIVYGHAFKPPPRLRLAAETSVSLDDMRTLMRTGRGPPGR